MLLISCPHCSKSYDDALEVLVPGAVVSRMRCEGCVKPFSYAFLECHRCELETVFTWRHEPPERALSLLTCERCGSCMREPDSQ